MRTYIPDCPKGRCSEKLWQPLPEAAVSLRGSPGTWGYSYHTHPLSDLFFGVSSLLALFCVLLSEVALSICLCRHSVASDVSLNEYQ